MSNGESIIGLFTCMWRLTKVISSWDDIADINEFDESEGESVEDDSCDSAYNEQKNWLYFCIIIIG